MYPWSNLLGVIKIVLTTSTLSIKFVIVVSSTGLKPSGIVANTVPVMAVGLVYINLQLKNTVLPYLTKE